VLNYIYLFGGERYMIDFATLDEVEERLDPKQFAVPTTSISLTLKRQKR
jgi:hypothetical protein